MKRQYLGSTGLAAISWLSVFAIIWLWILGIISMSWWNVMALIFFFVVALFATAVGSKK